MKNYIQEGDFITITAGAAIASGDLVGVGALVGVATSDIANGSTGEIQLCGVFEVPKEAQAMTQGCVLYFNATNKTATTTAGSNPANAVLGYAFTAAGSGDATVLVRLLW